MEDSPKDHKIAGLPELQPAAVGISPGKRRAFQTKYALEGVFTSAEIAMKRTNNHLSVILAVMILALLLEGCDNDTLFNPPPTITTAPVITLSANQNTPLAATLTLSTDTDTRVTLHTSDEVNSWTVNYGSVARMHTLPVRWLHPNRTHSFTVTVSNSSGESSVALTDTLTTAPLPANFPLLDITVHDVSQMEAGFTLFAPILTPTAYIIAVDTFGEVAWFLNFTESDVFDLRLLDNGHLLFNRQPCRNFEVDLDGNIIASWNANLATTHPACNGTLLDSVTLPIESTHHEVLEMPSGNLLTLSWGDVTGVNYPISESSDLGTSLQTIREDIVVEFARDGTIIRQHHMADILDPTRIGYDSVDGANDNDWTHGNGIIYDSRDNSYIFSARHQDAIFKFNRDTGDLVWILGTPGGWNQPWLSKVLIPTNFSGSGYSWHQHAPEITPEGNIIIFDNGNFRARPYGSKLPAGFNYSRAVEYSIDETTMGVTQVWAYGSPTTSVDGDYTPFIGDADVLPNTGNVLITFGGITRTRDTGVATDSTVGSAHNARIVEVTHTTIPEKVFEIYCGTLDHTDSNDCLIYRAEHISSLVPKHQ